MKYLVGIGYKNRLDLLEGAVNSIKPYWPNTVVIDNSDACDLRHAPSISSHVTVYEPPIPLTFPQKLNYLLERAKKESCDVLIWMHADAEPEKGVPEAFLQLIEEVNKKEDKWGVIFTNYDSFCAINIETTKDVDGFDPVFYQYFSDNDYYWRIYSAGYKIIQTDLPVVHHVSSVIKADSYYHHITSVTFPLYESYLFNKWEIRDTSQISCKTDFYPSRFQDRPAGENI